jgi:hypothetical protein
MVKLDKLLKGMVKLDTKTICCYSRIIILSFKEKNLVPWYWVIL